ncbi:MAG: hypothetical protein LBR97_05775 [Dysgonamonadaceae bacterium]|jgi:hypothetical protein|nr:hypothetical protein [Dysgonamonadaceae bacterium]
MKIQSKAGVFEMKINPESFKFQKNIKYKEFKLFGASSGFVKYDAHAPSDLSFDFVLDSTGLAYEKKETLDKTIADFEKIAYNMDGSLHKPNALTISWGSFVFKCHLKSLSYDYTLFSPGGEPLRVKVSASFTDNISLEESEKKANKQSPDMTHVITLKAGESIAMWCDKIYGDASYCTDIAQYNNLQGLRNIRAGTKIAFPPLAR